MRRAWPRKARPLIRIGWAAAPGSESSEAKSIAVIVGVRVDCFRHRPSGDGSKSDERHDAASSLLDTDMARQHERAAADAL